MPLTNKDIRVGEFRSWVTFYQNNPDASLTGGYVDNESVLLSCWGRLRQISGDRNISYGQLKLERSFTLITRYDPLFHNAINADTKAKIGERTFQVVSHMKVEELDFYYAFALTEDE